MKVNPARLRHEILVIGGGAGGLSVAAMLRRKRPDLDVAIVEPSEFHYYQPAWTLVGGGAYAQEKTRRPQASLIPKDVTWVRGRAAGFEPQNNRVVLEDGSTLEYRFLVVAAGIQLNWNKIEGLEETLGRNGVTSNYRYDLAPYTWQCIQSVKGGNALFTQPAMPIKCAGAPQKIMYLAADYFRRQGLSPEISFYTPGAAMFGVPFFSQALDRVVADYGIKAQFGHNLVAVDGPARKATFEVTQKDGSKTRLTQEFGMLHVVPPQSAPDFIRQSPLVDQSGWVSVDKKTLRHSAYDNVFALGDCTTTPNSKTAAAVKNQVPVLVQNLLRSLEGKGEEAVYDGYSSCPLTTSKGKIMLAEFCYDGLVTPSFPLDPRIPRMSYWWLKKSFLPYLYWEIVVRGKNWPITHKKRDFPQAVPSLSP